MALAVSLHAPNDALRDVLVPLNKKYPLRELMGACERYLEVAPRDFITFRVLHARRCERHRSACAQLVALTRDVPCKFNPDPLQSVPRIRSAFRRIRKSSDLRRFCSTQASSQRCARRAVTTSTPPVVSWPANAGSHAACTARQIRENRGRGA